MSCNRQRPVDAYFTLVPRQETATRLVRALCVVASEHRLETAGTTLSKGHEERFESEVTRCPPPRCSIFNLAAELAQRAVAPSRIGRPVEVLVNSAPQCAFSLRCYRLLARTWAVARCDSRRNPKAAVPVPSTARYGSICTSHRCPSSRIR